MHILTNIAPFLNFRKFHTIGIGIERVDLYYYFNINILFVSYLMTILLTFTLSYLWTCLNFFNLVLLLLNTLNTYLNVFTYSGYFTKPTTIQLGNINKWNRI